MPIPITDLPNLSRYADGVMERSDDHAEKVGGIALALLGAILWKADAATLEVFGSTGPKGNVLWVEISGQRYAFSYDHAAQEILMKEKSTQGRVLHRFSNATPVEDVEALFRSL
jgi:hypothetical protein